MTFSEVQDDIQAKNYVLRVKEGSNSRPLLKIVKVENMNWQLDCMSKIKSYLDDKLDCLVV